MQHLILTRLAVGKPSSEWLESRIRLFEEYCAPSVAGQTCQNFLWLLAVHADTPPWFIARAKQAAPSARFVYTKGETIYPNWSGLIPGDLIAPILLTTRFDSDDALHKDFVMEVQKVAKQQKSSCALNAPLGYRLDQGRLLCSQFRSKCNSFLSVIEFDSMQTAFCITHTAIETRFPVVNFGENRPLWMQIIHEKNVLNRIGRHDKSITDWNTIKK